MYFEKPVMEFVGIDLCDIETTSPGGSGSAEDCQGCDAAQNDCANQVAGGFMENTHANDSPNPKVKKAAKVSGTPKNVVGFDMTFDK